MAPKVKRIPMTMPTLLPKAALPPEPKVETLLRHSSVRHRSVGSLKNKPIMSCIALL